MTNPTDSLRISISKNEPPMQASKWLQVQALLDGEEVKAFFNELGAFEIYKTGCVCNMDEGLVSKEEFISVYNRYIDALKAGGLPDEAEARSYFSTVFTSARDHLFRVLLPDHKQIIRVCKPVIQLQLHKMDYSPVDGKFRPMVFGMDSVFWGIQFSYPQLYQDLVTKEVQQVGENASFPNTQLFRLLQRWIRHNTVPTSFQVGHQKINVPMRLGRRCLDWINFHPQLKHKQLRVLKPGEGAQ